MSKDFEVSCPWCGAVNLRGSFYWTFHCFWCRGLFYVNNSMRTCRVKRGEHLKWIYLDEQKQPWMN